VKIALKYHTPSSRRQTLARGFNDEAQFRFLLLPRKSVALLGRSESTLRREAKLLERIYLTASLIRRLSSSLLSSWACLLDTIPSTTLPFGTKRLKAARTLVVVFEEETNRKLAEVGLGD
jgi:hypothetical protein